MWKPFSLNNIFYIYNIILQALVVFAEGLEDKTSEIRAGSCKALQILEVRALTFS